MHLHHRRVKRIIRGLGWTGVVSDLKSDQRIVRVRVHSALFPVGDSAGAVLAWGFDVRPGAIQVLFVRLTEDEANRV